MKCRLKLLFPLLFVAFLSPNMSLAWENYPIIQQHAKTVTEVRKANVKWEFRTVGVATFILRKSLSPLKS